MSRGWPAPSRGARWHLYHATGPDMLRVRIDRLAVLASDQIEAGLTWLAGQRPDIFDAVVNAARSWGDGQAWDPVAALIAC